MDSSSSGEFAGIGLIVQLNWEYLADTGLIEITKPVNGSGVTDAVSCVKEFCAKHNVPYRY